MTARFRTAWALALLTCLFFSAAPLDKPAPSNPKDIELGQQAITPAKLKLHLNFIASDELEGRGTPSRGLDLAARYIASHMEYYGYQPAGDDGTYYQKLAMSRRKASKDSRIALQADGRTAEFKLGVDFLGSLVNAKGKLVFAGYGVSSKEADYDDYAGLDVKDKLVVVLDGYPDGMDAKLFTVERKIGNQTIRSVPPKFLTARERGALGAITLKGPEYTQGKDGKPGQFQQFLPSLDREMLVFDFQQDSNRPVAIDLTAEAGERLAGVLGIDLAATKAKIAETKKPQAVSSEASFELEFKTDVLEKLSTQNVVAFLEGSDPMLKEEIVAFSAHYDHLGKQDGAAGGRATPLPGAAPRPPGSTDTIYNGADDDGSGTVGILNLAEAFVAVSRPKRSLMFIWHTGEERGLWGSDYFVRNPSKPLDKFAALFNIDMIGRNNGDKEENANHVFLVGAAKTSTELREIILRTCGDRMRLDENDTRNYFRRSDHYNYAKHRIPVAFFCTGEHKDYHQPSDEVKSIRFDKMKQILDIVFECGLEVANRDARPPFTGEGL